MPHLTAFVASSFPTDPDDLAWDVLLQVVVPIVAAVIAAGIVAVQIRSDVVARRQERRGKAIAAATDLLLKVAETSFDGKARPTIAFMGFNRQLVEMYTYLSGKDLDVGFWVSSKNRELQDLVKAYDADGGKNFHDGEVGAVRGDISREAASSIDSLLSWLHQDKPTSWFTEELARSK